MNKFSAFILVTILPFFALAANAGPSAQTLSTKSTMKRIVIDVPTSLVYSSLQGNSDGSITVTEPKVFVQGQFTLVASEGYGWQEVCRRLGRKFETGNNVTADGAQTNDDRTAMFDFDGNFVGLSSSSHTIVYAICK